MATAKKKRTPAKKSPARKSAPKKVAPKKAAAKRTTARKSKSVSAKRQMQSFRVARDQEAFTSFRVTRQTVYWVILVSFIVFAQLWILSLQIEVASLIDAQQQYIENF